MAGLLSAHTCECLVEPTVHFFEEKNESSLENSLTFVFRYELVQHITHKASGTAKAVVPEPHTDGKGHRMQ